MLPIELTEYHLHNWRLGPAKAERLAAEILSIEGYSHVEPQSPLGGPDGKRDIVAQSGTKKYVCAVYFPTTRKKSTAVKKKFSGDLEGVARNDADGFIFITNQRLTPVNKKALRGIADPTEVVIYDLESMRAILDNPKGYGVRLGYLKIPMTTEEQLSFVTYVTRSTNLAVDQHTRSIDRLRNAVESIIPDCDCSQPAETSVDHAGLIKTQSHEDSDIVHTVPSSSIASVRFPIDDLDTQSICFLHRLVTYSDKFISSRGVLRNHAVWIGPPGSTLETAKFIPPPPEEVGDLLQDLLDTWVADYEKVSAGPIDERLNSIVVFHHRFVSIHPFLDANGRVAMLLLELQAIELLDIGESLQPLEGPEYSQALEEAHDGDLSHLTELIGTLLKL